MKVPLFFSDAEPTAAFFRHLAVGVVLVNLFVAGMMVLALNKSRDGYEERASVTSQNLALALEQYLAVAFDRIDLALDDIVEGAERQIAAGRIDAAAMNALIDRHRAPQYGLDSLRVSDAKGNALYGECKYGAQPPNVGDRDYFVRLRDAPSAGRVFAGPQQRSDNKKWIIVMARRINLPDGSFGGAVCAGILLESFNKFFSAIDLGRGGIVSLRDSELRLVSLYPDAGAAVGSTSVSPELRGLVAAGRSSGTYYSANIPDKIARMVTYRKIADYPYYIIVGLASDQYLATWRSEVVQLSILAVFFALTSSGLAWIFYQVWMNRIATSERAAQMRAMAMELTMTEERERQAIAQDLHDDLGQTLAIAKLKLTALEKPGSSPQYEVLMGEIAQVEAMIDKANRSVRSLSLQLSPPVLHQFGLVPALEWLAEEMRRTYDLDVRVHDDGKPKLLGENASNTLFRAVRELLINVAKHAGVGTTDVTTATEQGRLVISVADSGSGFDPHTSFKPSAAGGYGLFSVRERVRFIGGDMHVDSRPGDGTVVVLSISLNAAERGSGT